MFLKFIFCTLFAFCYGDFSWEELQKENNEKIDLIVQLWQESMDITESYDAALLMMGSFSYGTACPDSDMEFAVIHRNKNVNRLLDVFYDACKKEGLIWDNHGWHPPVSEVPNESNSLELLATPYDLAKLRAFHEKSTLRYALYHPKFVAGNRGLYEEFIGYFETFPFSSRYVLLEELPKTKKMIDLTERDTRTIKRFLIQSQSSGYPLNMKLDFKALWIKPTIELLQYLCIIHGYYPEDIEEAIETLENEKIISESLSDAVSQFLLYLIDFRMRFGKQIDAKNLSLEDLNYLVSSYQLLDQLYEITLKSK